MAAVTVPRGRSTGVDPMVPIPLLPMDTRRPRRVTTDWQVGDVYLDHQSRTRWIVRILNETTGAIELESANHAGRAHAWWRTNLTQFPKKDTPA